MKLEDEQKAICAKFKADYSPVGLGMKVWVGRTIFEEDLVPINGARQASEGDESGWYVWSGTERFDDPDFFVTMDVADLDDWCSYAMPYLALPAGYRFIIADEHEQVWFDKQML